VDGLRSVSGRPAGGDGGEPPDATDAERFSGAVTDELLFPLVPFPLPVLLIGAFLLVCSVAF